jgi:hypothetical protein
MVSHSKKLPSKLKEKLGMAFEMAKQINMILLLNDPKDEIVVCGGCCTSFDLY